MPLIDTSKLANLQKRIEQVRNICILAHVDHGKTTLADSLVASNGIISARMAGKLRYLDNRPDEQERGITMKSSSISLYYQDSGGDNVPLKDFLINLIDSPGHVDFSSEVSTAVRLCDGAIVVVDVVEGVCSQTRACLEQTYVEQLKPVLVLNKIDRLILEKQMTPLDAYFHISQLLEQVNAVLGNIFASDVLAKEDLTKKNNYESAFEDVDDSKLYFSPAAGNVVFCSAVDGWAFSVSDFAAVYTKRLGVSRSDLEQALWGNFYYNTKTNCVTAGAQEKAKKPMFVQFILENIWNLYETIVVRKDKEKLPVITKKLGIELSAREVRMNDPKALIKAVIGQWLPIDRTVLKMVVHHIPAPNVISEERAQRLLFPVNVELSTYAPETLALQQDFKRCDASSENVIVFVSKMIPVHVSQLPQNRPKRLTEEELQTRRDEVRKRIQERKQLDVQAELGNLSRDLGQLCTSEEHDAKEITTVENPETLSQDQSIQQCEFKFVAFARVFSGTIRPGMKLYNLMPKHDPRNPSAMSPDSPHITEVTVGDLYLLMGGELQLLDEVPAGNIVGIGGLENDIVKTATLSSTTYCTSFCELSIIVTPILRVAIEPVNLLEMPKLVKGLKLLNQADASVQVTVEPTGEHVITTLGEVHVEKCVRDLEDRYAKIKINVSKPIVSFRETIVNEATVDMVNEAIVRNPVLDLSKKVVKMQTPNKLCTIRVIALPLPNAVTQLLEKYSSFLKEIDISKAHTLSEKCYTMLQQIKTQLISAFQEIDLKMFSLETNEQLIESIWALGPRNYGTNILLNLSSFQHDNFWNMLSTTTDIESKPDVRRDYSNSFVNGFQLASAAGPICEEPMRGVLFSVLEWTIAEDEDLNSKSCGPFSGQILTTVREACRQAFQSQPQRLVSPMYSCNIVVNADVLGKMYAVIGRRHGKILSGDLTQGSANFEVMAVLPVIESFNFAQEIRKQTSGLACPQLMFSHWEVIDVDPFWVPTTEEEITHFGEKADSVNRAKVYMDSVRRRKGLSVDTKVVEHAEKQRTLSKKK